MHLECTEGKNLGVKSFSKSILSREVLVPHKHMHKSIIESYCSVMICTNKIAFFKRLRIFLWLVSFAL